MSAISKPLERYNVFSMGMVYSLLILKLNILQLNNVNKIIQADVSISILFTSVVDMAYTDVNVFEKRVD